MFIGQNKKKHVAFSFKNITRRKLNEERIRSHNESLKEIAFFEAHGLRRPITSLLGLINLMKTDKQHPENHELYLNQIDFVSEKIDDAIKIIIKKSDKLI